jgi:hypothetical protein
MKQIQIVRTFWGTMTPTYLSQIENSVNDSLNEIVYVWGTDNHDIITSMGFDSILVSNEPYDPKISNSHHFQDFRNMHHKLVCIDMATKQFGEILFLDWDCKLVKPLDENFYHELRNGNSIQAPLYVYPKESLNTLVDENNGDVMDKFFKTLKLNLEKYSYEWNNCYVVPNTGFVYCRDSDLTTHLCDLSEEFELEILVEEFALYVYASSLYSLEEYIYKLEPSVISGKSHGNLIWDEHQLKFDSFISLSKNKNNYFIHN